MRKELDLLPKRLKNDIPASEYILNTRLELLSKYAPEKVESFLK